MVTTIQYQGKNRTATLLVLHTSERGHYVVAANRGNDRRLTGLNEPNIVLHAETGKLFLSPLNVKMTVRTAVKFAEFVDALELFDPTTGEPIPAGPERTDRIRQAREWTPDV